MNQLEFFMAEARSEAELAAKAGEVPVGAIAVVDDVIVSRAHNTVEKCHDASCHAEMNLLRELAAKRGDWRMENVTIYVTKEPCAMCAGAMINSHVGKLVYGMSDPRSGGHKLNIFSHPGVLWEVEVIGDVLGEECLADFRKFFHQVRKGESPKPGREQNDA